MATAGDAGRAAAARGGRGFPESKYADVGPAAVPAATAERAQPTEAGRTEPEESEGLRSEIPAENPLVLPGESLAKYRGAPRTANERGRSSCPPNPSRSGLRPFRRRCRRNEGADVQTEQSVYEEPIHFPPENAVPDAPAHAAPDGSFPPRGLDSAELPQPPPLPEEAVSVQETADVEDAAQSGPVAAPMLDEDEDLRYPGDDPERGDRGWNRGNEVGPKASEESRTAEAGRGRRRLRGRARQRNGGGPRARRRFPHRVSAPQRAAAVEADRGKPKPRPSGRRPAGPVRTRARPPSLKATVPNGRERAVSAQVQRFPSPNFSRKARRLSSRSPRSRWDTRAPASPRTSPCRAATWCTCRRSRTWAFRAKSPATKSACG